MSNHLAYSHFRAARLLLSAATLLGLAQAAPVLGQTAEPEPAASRVQTLNTESIIHPHPDDWPSNGLDYREQRFSPLKQIDRASVSSLGLAWFTDIDYTQSLRAGRSRKRPRFALTASLVGRFQAQLLRRAGASARASHIRADVTWI